MLRLRWNSQLTVAFGGLALCLIAAYLISISIEGGHCKSGACTYIEPAIGKAYPGTCGEVKDDPHNCYCIANGNRTLVQRQLGCSLAESK